MRRPRDSKVRMNVLKALALGVPLLLTTASSCDMDLPIIEPRLENPHMNYQYYYKVQVHAHSDRSDGYDTPYSVLDAYRSYGYDLIALTDHDQPCSEIFSDPNDRMDEFIIYIPSEEDCDTERRHLLAIGLTGRYKGDPCTEEAGCCGPDCDDWNTQDRIDWVVQRQGGVAVIAHPYYKPWNEQEILTTLTGFHGIEVFNSTEIKPTEPEDNNDKALSLWVKLLDRGRRVWIFAGDDCHKVYNYSFNRSWIVVNSSKGPRREYLEGPGWYSKRDELQSDILNNIKLGNLYAVVRNPDVRDTGNNGPEDIGPKLEIKVLGGMVMVTADQECKEIRFIGSSNSILHTETRTTSAYYEVKGSEEYVRVEVDQSRSNGELYTAYLQPLYVIKQGYEGMVSDKETSLGIPEVRLTFTSEDGRNAVYQKTDSRGGYRIYLPKGRYVVIATHPNYQDYSSARGFWVVGDGFGTGNISMTKR